MPGLRGPKMAATPRLAWLHTDEQTNAGRCAKKVRSGTCYSASYTSQTRDQKQRFAVSEAAANWHELMIPQRTMRPSAARVSEQLYPRCSKQTYHSLNKLGYAFSVAAAVDDDNNDFLSHTFSRIIKTIISSLYTLQLLDSQCILRLTLLGGDEAVLLG